MSNVTVLKTSRDFVLAVAVLASSLLGCGGDRKSVVEAAPPADEIKAISCLGRIAAGEGALKIAAPPQAIVSELRVQRGPGMGRGDVLAVPQDYTAAKAALNEAEQQVAMAEGTLAQVKAPAKPALLDAQQAAVARQAFAGGVAARTTRIGGA